MKLRFVAEMNINGVAGFTNQFDNDSYVGILLRIKADNTAGANVDEDDAPRIRVNFRGDDIVNGLWTNFRLFCDLLYGMPEVAVAGATWQGGIFIPFYHQKLANAIFKRVGDNMGFYSATFGVVCNETCVVQVYGVIDDVPESYVPKLIDYIRTATAGQQKIIILQDNIAQIMMTEPETTPQDLLQLLVDNELLFSADWANLQNMSNIFARIEATALEVCLFEMVTKGRIDESLSDSATILSTGGTGDFYYLVQSLVFDPQITITTSNLVMDNINAKLMRKATTGKVAGTLITEMVNPRIVKAATRKIIAGRPEYKVLTPAMRAARTRRIVQ